VDEGETENEFPFWLGLDLGFGKKCHWRAYIMESKIKYNQRSNSCPFLSL